MKTGRIVLVGFMGCGKTSVAQALARRLNCKFIDLDTFITETCGRAPAGIIQEDGEPAFRAIETRALDAVLRQTEFQVIALGGGTWTIDGNRTLVALHECLSVWLDAPFELCWKRIMTGNEVRPLAPDRKTAEARYSSRISDYALTDRRMRISETDTPGTIAEMILNEHEWQ